MNMACRWFVGLDSDDKVFDANTFTKNREHLYGNVGAEALLGQVVRQVEQRSLVVSDRLVEHGTLLKAWASHQRFRPKDEEEPPSGTLGKFDGLKCSKKTHEYKADPDSKLFRKDEEMNAISCHKGTVMVDAVAGLVMAAKVSPPSGTGTNAVVQAALALAKEHLEPGQILVGDRGYDTKDFTDGVRQIGGRPHSKAMRRGSSLEGRTTSKASFKQSMSLRYIVGGFFGGLKSSGRFRQTILRGTEAVGWEFQLYCAAYNLSRLVP